MANFVEDIVISVDSTLALYVGNTFQNITSGSGTFITALVTLYFIYLGIGTWTGKVQLNMAELIKRVLKISTALGFFLSWPLFDGFVVAFITNTPDALAAKATGSASATISGAMGDTFDAGMAFVGKIFASGGWGLQYILGLFVLIAVVAQVVYALFLIILSKIAVSLLLGFAPVFLMFLMFDSTQRMVDSWIQQLANYSFVILFTIGIITIMNSLTSYVIQQADNTGNTDLGTVIAPSVVLLITTIILMQVTSISSSIAGGIQLSSLGSGRLAAQGTRAMAGLSMASFNRMGKGLIRRYSNSGGGKVSKA